MLHFPVSKPNQDDASHVGRFVYSMFIALLFQLAASGSGGRGSTDLQDPCSNRMELQDDLHSVNTL